MATLAENVSKLVAALTQDKAALAEMGVEVPEGTKHSDVAGLIKKVETGGPGLCTVSITLLDPDVGQVKSGRTVSVFFNGEAKGTYELNPDSPYRCVYGPGTYRFEYETQGFVPVSWKGVKEVVVPFEPQHFDISIEPQDDGKLHFQMRLLNYTKKTVYVMDWYDGSYSNHWGHDVKNTVDLNNWSDNTFEVVVDKKFAGTNGVISDDKTGFETFSTAGDYPESEGWQWTGAKFTFPSEYETVTVDWNNKYTEHWSP